MEIDRISDPAKKAKVSALSKAISEIIPYNEIIKKRAIEIQALAAIHPKIPRFFNLRDPQILRP